MSCPPIHRSTWDMKSLQNQCKTQPYQTTRGEWSFFSCIISEVAKCNKKTNARKHMRSDLNRKKSTSKKNGESSRILESTTYCLWNCTTKNTWSKTKTAHPETPLTWKLKKSPPQFNQGKSNLNEKNGLHGRPFLGSRAPLDWSKVLLPHTVAAIVPAIMPWKSPLV